MLKAGYVKIGRLLFCIIFLIGCVCPVKASDVLAGQHSLSPFLYAPMLRGLVFDVATPLQFQFLIETPQQEQTSLQTETEKLIKYFLAALTTPEDKLWVNLSPVEPDQIIEENFGKTAMGRDLLKQDYLLKRLTASLLHPDHHIGKMFWDKVYQVLQQTFGTTDIPVQTFHKVWITPDKAKIYSKEGKVYIFQSHLKVQLEEDFQTALLKQQKEPFLESEHQEKIKKILYEIVIPAIEKEINESKEFQLLRQIYHALILSAWFKRYLKEHLLNETFSERNKNSGLNFVGMSIEDIYQQYMNIYQEGIANIVKEEKDFFGETVARHYFSGGFHSSKKIWDDVLEPQETFLQDSSVVSMISGKVVLQTHSKTGDVKDPAMADVLRKILIAAPSITGDRDEHFGKVVKAKTFFRQLSYWDRAFFINAFFKNSPFQLSMIGFNAMLSKNDPKEDILILVDPLGHITGGAVVSFLDEHRRHLSDFWTFPTREGKGSFFLKQISEWLLKEKVSVLSWKSDQEAVEFYLKFLTPLMEYRLETKYRYEFQALLKTMGNVQENRQKIKLARFQQRWHDVDQGMKRLYEQPGTYILRHQLLKGEIIFTILNQRGDIKLKKKSGAYLSVLFSKDRLKRDEWLYRELTFQQGVSLSRMQINGDEEIVIPTTDQMRVFLQHDVSVQQFSFKDLAAHLYDEVDEWQKGVLLRHYGNRQAIWILSNENRQEMIQALPVVDGQQNKSVHVGFSGMINLDIMAKQQSAYGVIGDVNENMLRYYQMIKHVLNDPQLTGLSLFEARHRFCELLIQAFDQQQMFSLDTGAIRMERVTQLRELLKDETSWLGTDKGFEYIRGMFKEGRISVIPLDIRDTAKFSAIAGWLKKRGLRVDTIYTSNIDRYFSDDPWMLFNSFGGLKMNVERSWERYEINLKSIASAQTLLIRSDPLLKDKHYRLVIESLAEALEKEVTKFVAIRSKIQDYFEHLFPSKEKILKALKDFHLQQRGEIYLFDFYQAWKPFMLNADVIRDLQRLKGTMIEQIIDRLRMHSRQHVAGTVLTTEDGKWKYRSGLNALGYFMDVKELWPVEVGFEYPVLPLDQQEQVELKEALIPFMSIWQERVVRSMEGYLYGKKGQEHLCLIYVTKDAQEGLSYWVAPRDKLALVNQVTKEHLIEMIGERNFEELVDFSQSSMSLALKTELLAQDSFLKGIEEGEGRIINVKGLSEELREELIDIILQKSSISFSRNLLKAFIVSQKMFSSQMLLWIDEQGDILGGVVIDKVTADAYALQYVWVVEDDLAKKRDFFKLLFKKLQENFFFMNAVYWESLIEEIPFYEEFLKDNMYGKYVVDKNRVFWTAYMPAFAGKPVKETLDDQKKMAHWEKQVEIFSHQKYFTNSLVEQKVLESIPPKLMETFIQYWQKLQQTTWQEDQEDFHPLDIQYNEDGFYFIGFGGHFHRAIATWAGWIDEHRNDEQWRHDIKQTQYRTSSLIKRDFIHRAGKIADYLGENILQHASFLGGISVVYDAQTGGGWVVVMDQGKEGFPMDIELMQGGFIQQKSDYHGDGIAMKYIKQQGDVVILSHGKYVNLAWKEQRAMKPDVHQYQGPYAELVRGFTGTMMIVRIPGQQENKKNENSSLLKDVGGIDLNPAYIDWEKEAFLKTNTEAVDVDVLKQQVLSSHGLSFVIVNMNPVDNWQTIFF